VLRLGGVLVPRQHGRRVRLPLQACVPTPTPPGHEHAQDSSRFYIAPQESPAQPLGTTVRVKTCLNSRDLTTTTASTLPCLPPHFPPNLTSRVPLVCFSPLSPFHSTECSTVA